MMGESVKAIPQQEMENDSAKISLMCVGLNCVITVPTNTVSGITIVITKSVIDDVHKRTQLVTNSTLKIAIHGKQY